MENKIHDEKTVYGMRSREIIIYLVWNSPKKKQSQSVYGGNATQST